MMGYKQWVLSLLLVIAVVHLSACSGGGTSSDPETTDSFPSSSTTSDDPTTPVLSFNAAPYPAPPGGLVTLTASISDPNLTNLEYRFNFGDGSKTTDYGPSPTVQHSYSQPGHYQAVVQARDLQQGYQSAQTLTVTVIEPPKGPLAKANTAILCDTENQKVWTVNPDNNSVTRLHAESLGKELEVTVGKDPRNIAKAADNTFWVTLHDDDRIDIIRDDGSLLNTISLQYGDAPFGIVISPDGQTAYVSLQGSGKLARFNVASRTETGRISLGPTPRALALSGDGKRLLLTRYISPPTHGEVWDVDTTSFSLTRTIRLAKDRGPDTESSSRGVLNFLNGIAITPDGSQAWVAGKKDNTDRGLVADGFGPLSQDTTVRAVVANIDLASSEEVISRRFDIDNADAPYAIGFSPLGDYGFVTLQGNNQVAALDAFDITAAKGFSALKTRFASNLAPQGICVDSVKPRLFAKSLTERKVTSLDLSQFLTKGKINAQPDEVSTVSSESMSSEVLLGKQIFYNASDPRMSGEGYISCASCHADGGHDGRTRDFTQDGEGFRDTTSLRGRSGIGHGNVHWSANFDEIQDFENPIRNLFGGSGFLSDDDFNATANPLGPPKAGLNADLDALAAYVTSLDKTFIPRSPHRAANGLPTASAIAGFVVFTAENCASCHKPSQGYIDLASHNVGTLGTDSGGKLGGPLSGIDTPTLLGVHATAPYFHNGSAATLEEVFRIAGGVNLQAEEATLIGASEFTGGGHVYARHGSYTVLDEAGDTLQFSSVDGSFGGTGMVRVRYSAGEATELIVNVNGNAVTVPIPSTQNSPGTPAHDVFKTVDLDIQLNAGATNTIAIRINAAPLSPVAIDEIVVSRPSDLALAAPHRRVLSLSATERQNLVEFLKQLDGSN